MEKKAETLFRTYKLELISKLGRKALNNDTIDKYGKRLFQTKYKGSFAQDQKFEKKIGLSANEKEIYVINKQINED